MQITLKAARVNAGFTQKEVANMLKRNPSTIINWESGKTYPTANSLAELCNIYKLSINDIFLLEQSS